MKRIIVASGIALVVMSGCATPPDRIAAIDLPTSVYANETCAGLAAERSTTTAKLAVLEKKQNKAVMDDAAGVFLIGLPVSSMTGGDQEVQIAAEKGKLQAIDRSIAEKQCS
ncbi:MAG: hypothetical protein K8H74_11800 [Notoacmeibacter sp.]|nr:hypothetical protein [Notoacmeibacter sp.]